MPGHRCLSLSPRGPPPPWLDALPDSAAVIDENGIILAVNGAWRAFAGADQGAPQGDSGENALAIFRNAPVAAVGGVRRSLAEVLRGSSNCLEWGYTCHSPGERRWYRLIATRFLDRGRPHVLLLHRGITSSHLNEEPSEPREQQLESVLVPMREDCVLVQRAHAVRPVNPGAGEFPEHSSKRLSDPEPGVPIPSRGDQFTEFRPSAEGSRSVKTGTVGTESGNDPVLLNPFHDITGTVAADRALTKNEDLFGVINQVAGVEDRETGLSIGESRWTGVTRNILDIDYPKPARSLDEALPSLCKGERYQVACGKLPTTPGHGMTADLYTPLQMGPGRNKRIHIRTQPKLPDGELERLNARLANVLENISDAFYTLTPDWFFDYVNSAAGRITGRSPQDLVGKNLWSEFPALIGTPIEHEYRRAMHDQVTVTLEEYYKPLGVWWDIRAYPTEDALAVYVRDVTERHAMADQLRSREEELSVSRDELAATLQTRQMLINGLPAHISLVDADGTILDVNQQWRQYGIEHGNTDPDTGIGRNYFAICDDAVGDCVEDARAARDGLLVVLNGERESFSLEYPCHGPDRARWFRMMVNRIGGDRASGAVVMHVDITERKLAEQELNRLAYRDALTGLPSRNGFVQALADRLGHMGWKPGAMLIMFDIQRHRDINDSHGYAVGDRLLQLVAERFNDMAGEDALVGRVGGDEFVAFLPGRANLTAPQMRAQIGSVFNEPFVLDDLRLEINARFGYTLLDEEPRAYEELLHEAELALFESTSNENNRDWTAYSSAIDHEVRKRVEITQQLRHALAGNEFQLHFQPKVKLDTGELVASEALLRWYHPEHGLRSPTTFIAIAEQSQLIGPIGDWVLDEACRHLRAWQDAHLDIVHVAVNVSLLQFTAGDFPETVRSTLQRHDVPPGALTLEITESVFEHESDILNQQLRTLHDMGVRLSLDDFGTGYSSLLYLQRYPFDEIKIDQGFIRRMLEDSYSRQIVNTVIGVAGALNADAVAEGVECAAERDALLAMGCHIGQGFYYSMPLESEDFRWLLKQHTHLPLSRASGDQF